MGHLLPLYQLDERGQIRWRMFDKDQWPAGWYDAPDKVPGHTPVTVEPLSMSRPDMGLAPIGTVYGEKRKPGWPKGKPRK